MICFFCGKSGELEGWLQAGYQNPFRQFVFDHVDSKCYINFVIDSERAFKKFYGDWTL